MRYAWHGSEQFDQYLHQILKELSLEAVEAVGSNLLAIVLTGGYGRSEGGIVVENGIEKPYNDLDLVPIIESYDYELNDKLMPVSQKYAEKLNIHVDFSRPLTPSMIKNLPHKLMWQDVLNGHIVLYGDQEIFKANMPSYMKKPLPVIEASHLLLNRGAGLIWSTAILEGHIKKEEDDFVRRNYYKAALAIGDALLIFFNSHQTSYRGRDDLLRKLLPTVKVSNSQILQSLYEKSLQFKFSPDKFNDFKADISALKELSAMLVEIFLFIESKRCNRMFSNAKMYSKATFIREQSEHLLRKFPRNLYHNLKARRLSLRYPREKLYRLLPVLLTSNSKNIKWKKQAIEFLKVWQKFN